MPLVENLVARGLPGRRVRPAEIQDPVTRALEARFGAAERTRRALLGPRFLLRPRGHRAARLGPPRRRGGGREGAPGHGPRREGVHAREAAGRPAQGRSLLRAHAALVLRAAQPAPDRPAQGLDLPVRPAGGDRPRHALRARPARARRVPRLLRQARHLPGGVRSRGHRADPGRAPSPRLSPPGRGSRAHRDDARE